MTNKEQRETQFRKNQQKNNEDYILPNYYESSNGVSLHDLINAKFSKYQQIDISEFNVTKYLFRWREKNGIEDLIKAKYYMDNMVKMVKEVLEEEEQNED